MDDTTNKPAEGHDWRETWKKNLHLVDDKLIEFFKDAGEKAGDVAEQAKAKVHEMLDKTDMDEKARANWDKAKADSKLVGAQIENRIAHLIADGKITWAKWTKKEGEK
jgi:ElaB/YqjD/DUF883 family membrane-anchored ribosome-binding protein